MCNWNKWCGILDNDWYTDFNDWIVWGGTATFYVTRWCMPSVIFQWKEEWVVLLLLRFYSNPCQIIEILLKVMFLPLLPTTAIELIYINYHTLILCMYTLNWNSHKCSINVITCTMLDQLCITYYMRVV